MNESNWQKQMEEAAKKKCPDLRGGNLRVLKHSPEPLRNAFASGATWEHNRNHGLAVKFAEWMDHYFGRKWDLNIPGPWYSLDDLLGEEPKTTAELYEEFLNELTPII